jgi:methylmalonyl-CoA mutase N-terminal domain/subunit
MKQDKRLTDYFQGVRAAKARKEQFTTLSGQEKQPLYLPKEPDEEYFERIGLPGQYPFTRGPYPSMYRGRLWTMRMFAGFGTPEDTNNRFKYLLKAGQTGLSTAFDMPTLMGYDPDHALSAGEVGKEGVSVANIDDMHALFADIPLDKVTTSMTINAPAIVMLALYVAIAQERSIPLDRIGGTTQNDILKEFIAQKEWISPPRPAIKLVQDTMVYCSRHVPRWHPISISGYHIREAGATAVQELAFTLADGIGYAQAGIEAGLDIDEFAPRSASSSTSTTSSLRKLPNCGPLVASGLTSCATVSRPGIRVPGRCEPTARRQASHSPPNSLTTTWYERHTRPWQPF